jgi:CCR4-NOT transcription complex subunit 9
LSNFITIAIRVRIDITMDIGAGGIVLPAQIDEKKIHQLILQLINNKEREHALQELSKIRESYDALAILLWYSFGTMAALLQEIVSIYPLLNSQTMTTTASTRACNALALMQCIASHPETRPLFIHAQFPLYLYPILNTNTKSRPFEYLRLTSLGVIGALVKNDDPDVVSFLITTEIIPLCLRIMETGNELCKTVAIFILQKTLLDEQGLGYICHTTERLYAVLSVLDSISKSLLGQPSARLLKHIVRCYIRLAEHKKASDAMKQSVPELFKNESIVSILPEEDPIKRSLAQLALSFNS